MSPPVKMQSTSSVTFSRQRRPTFFVMPVLLTRIGPLTVDWTPNLRGKGFDHETPPSSDHDISTVGSVCIGSVPVASPTPCAMAKDASGTAVLCGEAEAGPLSTVNASASPSSLPVAPEISTSLLVEISSPAIHLLKAKSERVARQFNTP